jgi:hypothetical protein
VGETVGTRLRATKSVIFPAVRLSILESLELLEDKLEYQTVEIIFSHWGCRIGISVLAEALERYACAQL